MKEDLERRETERRELNKEMLAKFQDVVSNIHSIKGQQAIIKQYLEGQFGGVDLVGTPTEGKVTRDLRELNEKVKIQNGRVGKSESRITDLEHWRWQLLGIAIGAGAVIGFIIKVV